MFCNSNISYFYPLYEDCGASKKMNCFYFFKESWSNNTHSNQSLSTLVFTKWVKLLSQYLPIESL